MFSIQSFSHMVCNLYTYKLNVIHDILHAYQSMFQNSACYICIQYMHFHQDLAIRDLIYRHTIHQLQYKVIHHIQLIHNSFGPNRAFNNRTIYLNTYLTRHLIY
ncbi:hypothetical protein V6Z12_A13G176800 [Gossypium hirsutum]